MSNETALLDPTFLGRLARLRLAARRRFAGVTAGSRRAKGRGASAELADHRRYDTGDDLRRIDWNAYARFEELILRLFIAEEDLSVYFLIDTSASLGTISSAVHVPSGRESVRAAGGKSTPDDGPRSSDERGRPTKLDVAKRLAAGLGYIALTSNERVSVMPFSSRAHSIFAPSRGRRRLGAFLRHLERLRAENGTDLNRAVNEFLDRRPKAGLVIVLSDFLDPRGYRSAIDRLCAAHHEPVLFHILSCDDVEPAPGSDVLLVDSETGDSIRVSLDSTTLTAYRKRLQQFLDELQIYARKRGIHYALIVEDLRPIEDSILDYLERRRSPDTRAVVASVLSRARGS